MNINTKKYMEEVEQGKYPLLKSITVKNKNSYGQGCLYDIEIVLSSDNNELICLFQDAFDIKIIPIDGIFDVSIEIMNSLEMQIENADYYVSGNEEELFSFYCKSFIFYDL